MKKLVYHQLKLANRAKLDAIYKVIRVKDCKKIFKKKLTSGISLFKQTIKKFKSKQAKNGSDWLVIGRPIIKGIIKKSIMLIDHLKMILKCKIWEFQYQNFKLYNNSPSSTSIYWIYSKLPESKRYVNTRELKELLKFDKKFIIRSGS